MAWKRFDVKTRQSDTCGVRFCGLVEEYDELVESKDGELVDYYDASCLIDDLVEGLELTLNHIQSAEVRSVITSLIESARKEAV